MKTNKVITKILKGHTGEFEKLIDFYGKKVYGYIFSRVRDQYLAEDLFQEVWLKVYKNLYQFKPDELFSPWLIRIARNTIYDYYKQKKIISLPIYEKEIISKDNLEEMILHKESMKHLDASLLGLKDEYRLVIELRYFDEMSYKAIAKHLNIEEKIVKWRLYEGKKQLQKIFFDKEETLCHVKY